MKKVKCAFQDYTEDNLPLTRRDVFLNCYKERFSVLFKLGLICLILVVPFVVISFLKESYILYALEKLTDKTETNIVSIFLDAELTFGVVKIVCYCIFAIFFAGVVQILRQTLWDEPLFFVDDFKNGIKNNAIRFCITAIILALIDFVLNMYSKGILKSVLNGIFVSFILPVSVWYVLQTIYYKSKITIAIKNAEILYLKTIPITLLLLICTILPFWCVTHLVSLLIVRYIVLFAMSLFYIVPITMFWMLYACHIFDKIVNKEYNPQIYRKGMRPLPDDNV